MRLDIFLVQKHHFTRNKAQQIIDAGLVSVNNKIIKKSSYEVTDTDGIVIEIDRRVRWVSRSAEKLAGFLENRENGVIQISGSYCLDVGSSTGGFTQVLLELGAAHVDAVDVGTKQLHETIRHDSRVKSYEQMDIREFSPEKSIYDIIVCDASFISLYEILPSIFHFTNPETNIILLYKPQFEVWPEHLRKTWVPKDEKIVIKKMQEFEKFVVDFWGDILAKEKSTLQGEAGNQEWIYLIRKWL